jgi:hypothetical protein
VVIGDADLMGVVVLPFEDDPPLLIDADAVEVPQVSGQLFETVAGRNPKP